MASSGEARTRGEQMLALRRARMSAAPPVLRGGFRPFFIGSAAWALVVLVLWLLALAGAITLPTAFDILAWHRHEMLFGFVGAAIAGFLLTAIPNWTGRLPIAGAPLLALFALWLAARLALLGSAVIGGGVPAMLDIGFYLVLAGLVGREVIAAHNRNLPIVGLLILFAGANALDHAAAFGFISDDGLGWRAALALVVMMISLIGGRIIPSFTRNWLVKQGERERLPGQPMGFDAAVLSVTGIALATWAAMPDGDAAKILLITAGALQALRLARWRGLRVLRDPLVAVLHIGYCWIPIGLLLLGGSAITDAIPRSAAIHALTAGAMATMVLAVMTRATLGHTGHALHAGGPTIVLYALVTVGALLRVAAPLQVVDFTLGMRASALAWGGAFVLFLAAYGPILFRPRLGDA